MLMIDRLAVAASFFFTGRTIRYSTFGALSTARADSPFQET